MRNPLTPRGTSEFGGWLMIASALVFGAVAVFPLHWKPLIVLAEVLGCVGLVLAFRGGANG